MIQCTTTTTTTTTTTRSLFDLKLTTLLPLQAATHVVTLQSPTTKKSSAGGEDGVLLRQEQIFTPAHSGRVKVKKHLGLRYVSVSLSASLPLCLSASLFASNCSTV